MCILRNLFCFNKPKKNKKTNVSVPSFLLNDEVNNQPLNPLVLPLTPTIKYSNITNTPPRYNSLSI